MEVRDAVEADADALAAIVDAPADVMRNVVHDRTVRVAVRQSDPGPNADVDVDGAVDVAVEGGEPGGDAGDATAESVLGFVSFDAREDTVYVTQFGGTSEACERLIGEPIRFATNERMSVELLVEATDEELTAVAESAGFDAEGRGPSFGGQRTIKYRLDPKRSG
jgi:hypothetical protein